MNTQHSSRRYMVLALALGLVLSGIAPAAAARKAPEGWDRVDFSGKFMFYETIQPVTGPDLSSLVIKAYDGEFKPNKRTTYPASILVAEASGGQCILDDDLYGTETGLVMKVVHVIGAQEVGDAITFEPSSSRAGSLEVGGLTMKGTRSVWEAEYLGLGTQSCSGITLLSEQPIEKTLDIALAWSSVTTDVFLPKGKGPKSRTETRWVTSITSATGTVDTTSATGTVDTVDLSLPFGPVGADDYLAQSFHVSGSVMIPTGTFE